MKAFVLSLICAVPFTTSATLVGFNFTSISGGGGLNGANGTFDDLTGFGTAGVGPYAQANWNHFEGDWGGETVNDAVHAGLVDSTGAAVNGAIGRYWLEDFAGTVLTDQVGISANEYTGSFLQAGGANFSQTLTPGNVDVATGNYLVFDNITADTIRVRSAGNGDPEDFGRGPLNAVQLLAVVVPEPASGMLLLGGAGLLAVVRKMRVRV